MNKHGLISGELEGTYKLLLAADSVMARRLEAILSIDEYNAWSISFAVTRKGTTKILYGLASAIREYDYE